MNQLCRNTVISSAVTLVTVGGVDTLVIDTPAATYRDGDCLTLLIRRDMPEAAARYGNHADDDVEDYPYDVIFDNNRPLEQSAIAFGELIDTLLQGKEADHE